MKKYLRFFILPGILSLIGALIIYLLVYDKPQPDYSKAQPEFILNAAELYQAYIDNRMAAKNTYDEKVIQVTGRVDDIEIINDRRVIIFSFETGMLGAEGVRCTMLPAWNDAVDDLEIGDYIAIKGYCAGFHDPDVMLEKCSLVG